jgi:two-component system nitrogen regulation response regulator NtrX
MGDWNRMRMWLLAIAAAILGANALDLAGLVDLRKSIYPTANFTWLSYVVGGFLFGVGMTLGSGCGSKTLVRVGGHRQIRVDVRVVSSSSRALEKEIAERRFREDLYYRLNVVPVAIPSLIERREDIPALADHFFARYANEQGVQPPTLSPEAIAAMQSYDWPGNVRQLRNVVERTIILAPRERLTRIDADMLPSEIVSTRLGADTSTSALMGVPLREARENFEREYLKVQIRRFSGNISKTASFIGMERSALHRKLKLLGMAERREDEDVD